MNTFIYNIKNFFTNLWVWRKILWSDKNFDSQYLIDILIFKLKLIKKNLNNKTNNDLFQNAINKIDTIIKLFNIVYINDKYLDDAITSIENKYGKRELKIVEDKNEKFKSFDFVFINKNYTIKKLDNIKKEEIIALKNSRKQAEKAKKLVWKMINQYIEYWWD